MQGRNDIRIPSQQRHHRSARATDSDCSKTPVQNISAWGPKRFQFMSFPKQMEVGSNNIRARDCETESSGPKADLSRAELNDKLYRERITTAALTYIDGVAFNSNPRV